MKQWLFLRLKSAPTPENAPPDWSYAAARSLFTALAAILNDAKDLHVSLELTAKQQQISIIMGLPQEWEETIKHHLYTCYPALTIERLHHWKSFVTSGHYYGTSIQFSPDDKPLKSEYQLESDVPDSCLSVLSSLQSTEGASIQLLLRTSQQKQPFFSAFTADFKMAVRTFVLGIQDSPDMDVKSDRNSTTQIEASLSLVAIAPTLERSTAIVNQLTTVFHRACLPGEAKVKQIKPARLSDWLKTVARRDILCLPLFRLTIEELANLFHLPVQPRQYPRLISESTTLLPPPQSTPTQGLFLGAVMYRGRYQPIYLSAEDRLRHLYLIGQTGTGKSTLFQSAILQDISRGEGCCFIDPHGEAIEWILDRIPPKRVSDVVLFDPGDSQGALGLNLLEWQNAEERDLLIQELIYLFYKLFDPERVGIIGPQFEHWLRNAALTVTEPKIRGTLVDIPRLFTDPDYLDFALQRVEHPAVLDFWQNQMSKTTDFHKSEMLNYFTSKFGSFLGNDIMRSILSQPHSAFQFRTLMDKKKILLVNLSKGKLGSLNAVLLGTIVMTKLQMAALSRANEPPEKRTPFYVYIDEFQNIATDSFATMLSEIRKYGLSLHLAHQYVDQLSLSLRQAIIGNVGTIAAFRIGQSDAEWLSPHFDPLNRSDLTNIQPYHYHIRPLMNGNLSSPFTLRSLPLKCNVNSATGVIIRNRVRQYIRYIRQLQQQSVQQKYAPPEPQDESCSSIPI